MMKLINIYHHCPHRSIKNILDIDRNAKLNDREHTPPKMCVGPRHSHLRHAVKKERRIGAG